MLLDPRNNLLTVIFAAALVVLVLALGAQALLMGDPDVAAIEPVGGGDSARAMVATPETGLEDMNQYAVITERPLFFEDRTLPEIEPEDAVDGEEAMLAEQEPEEPVPELKATVSGIIITPEVRMAFVNDDNANKTLVLREGMSLEGDLADWKLESIAPRKANFVASDGKQAELELKVNTGAIESGRPPSRPDDNNQRQARDRSERSGDEEARARAEEVRRRVAERRAELRAEAERRARQARENNGGN